MVELEARERAVAALLAENRKAEAIHMLYGLVLSYAGKREFHRAEYARRRMQEIDDMALSAIAAAGDAIEQEIQILMDSVHRQNWKKLYARLTPGERSAFFFACTPLFFFAGDVLFFQGRKNNHLFFVEEGHLQLVFVSAKRVEKVFRLLGPGEFAGEDTFFGASFCGASLVAMEPGLYRKISLETLEALDRDFPGLYAKVQAYCQECGPPAGGLMSMDLSRREWERVPAAGVLVFQILEEGEAPLWKGLLTNFSAGGLSFLVRTPNDRAIRALLGKTLGMKFLKPGEKNRPVVCKGSVVGILPCGVHAYTLHVKFAYPLFFPAA